MKIIKSFFKGALPLVSMVLMLASCGSTKNIAYLADVSSFSVDTTAVLYDARIMPKDVLTITVNTINPAAAQPFNLAVSNTISQSNMSLTSQPTLQTYLVDNNGNIEFPVVGTIRVLGLTKCETEQLIVEKIRPYLAEEEKPIVTVRMSNYSIAVLGEVNNPGNFLVSREKINIFEALARAGDMTIYGLRDNVKLVREDAAGKKSVHILNLNETDILKSPYYYLQQNDIVIVEPNKAKAQNSNVGNMTTLWFSATSILVSVATLLVSVFK